MWLWTLGALAQEPSLATYLDAAVANNPRGALARAATESAQAEVLDAAAGLLPTVRGNAAWTYNQFEAVAFLPDPAGGSPEEIVIVPREQVAASLGLRVPLFDGPAWARWRGFTYGVDASGDAERAVEQDLRMEVARAWYGASAADQVVGAAEQARAAAAENLRFVALRGEAGVASDLSVQRAELAVANADLLRIDAMRTAAGARRRLATLSGLPEPGALPAPPDRPQPVLDPAAVLAAAEATRPEIAAAEARVRQLRLAHRGTWLAWTPTIAGTAAESFTNASGFSGETASWRVGVEADWLLVDFGDRTADSRRAHAALATAEAALRQAREAVQEEVHAALLDLDSAIARVEATGRGAKVGRGAADEARLRFQAGTATQVEVIEAERDALDALVRRIGADGELAVARLALQRAIGAPIQP